MLRVKIMAVLPVLLVLGACNRDPHALAVRSVENGNKFFEREKYKEASIMYRRAIQPNADPRYGEAYYRLGLVLLKLGSPTDAYRSFQNAIEFQPQNADAFAKLADLELIASAQGGKQGPQLREDSKAHAEKLVKIKGGEFDGERILGSISLLENQPAEAVAHFQKAYAIKADDPSFTSNYFVALTLNNQFPEAEALAKGLIAKNKTFGPIYDLLYTQYVQRKSLPEAEAILKLKSENDPTNVQNVLTLATFYAGTNQREKMDAAITRLNDEKTFAQGHLAAGDFYFLRMHDFDHAQKQYEAGIQADPKGKLTYQKRLIELFASTNRGDEANKLMAEVLKAAPDDQEAVAIHSALRLTTGNREQVDLAVNDLQSLVAKTPGNYLLHFNLARGLLAKGELEQARLQLEETIKLRPDLLGAHEYLSRIYLSRNEGAKALQEADEMIKQDPNNLPGHLARSSALLMMQDNTKAREELALISQKFPQSADAKYQAGYMAFQQKDYAKAGQIFEELHKENPKEFRGLVGTVEAMARQQHLPEAIKEMEKAAAGEPDRVDLKVALANLYVRAERYDDAIKIYNDVLSKNPKAADILFKLAETFRRKGDINQSIDTFRKASQAAPNDAAPLIQLGLLMDSVGQHDHSKPIYEQVLRIQPDNPFALNNLAYIKADEGNDLDSALSMAQKAYQALPTSPDVADTLGWVYIKKNLSPEAVRLYTDLVQKNPANPTYRMHYGMALMLKVDRPAAKRELETALKNSPKKDDVTRIQEILRTM